MMTDDLGAQVERATAIMAEAVAEYRPVEIFAGFSGGHDSLVSTHFTMGWSGEATALHLNTGIGIEATRRFVRSTAADRSWSFHEATTAESYDDMILGRVEGVPGGFPGPAMHATYYQRLKERPLRKVASEARSGHPRGERRWVMIVTGIRGDESAVRTGYQRAVSVQATDSLVWVNPFYWATADHFRAYRERHDLPSNPVCTRLGFSGECLCGAFADTGELCRIRATCPATADRIEALQVEAANAGYPWGYEQGPPRWFAAAKRGQSFFPFHDGHRPMCHNCEKVKRVPDAISP
jgi:3'-phosphoadenosine 5'-phosphosulfate sulfotransferase (PAPS reductase)/FAD synthetase